MRTFFKHASALLVGSLGFLAADFLGHKPELGELTATILVGVCISITMGLFEVRHA